MSKTLLSISSVTKKITMAIAGLFLIMFLVVHLGINLFLLPIHDEHKEWFTAAAHFMGTNWIVKLFELVLMAAFLIHILMGIILQLENWRARGTRYKVASKSKTSFMSKYIIWTGLVIFMFLILHFYHFYFIKLGFVEAPVAANIPHPQEEYFFDLAVWLFSNDMVFNIIYLVAFVVLSIHLNHAFQSAFQTLGLNHKKYTPFIKGFGNVYSVVVPAGYAIIPLYYMFFA